MNRVFPPLKSDHPLATSWDRCPICRTHFCVGQRVVLIPVREVLTGVESIPAVVVHAACSLEGLRTSKGEIQRIKDGDSPCPVVTDEGEFTFRECGIFAEDERNGT